MGTSTNRPIHGALVFTKDTREIRLRNYYGHSISGMALNDINQN